MIFSQFSEFSPTLRQWARRYQSDSSLVSFPASSLTNISPELINLFMTGGSGYSAACDGGRRKRLIIRRAIGLNMDLKL